MPELPDSPKRFIAGAKCPQCQQLDRLAIFRRAGIQFRECVACGFQEEMMFEAGFRELETRVNRSQAEREADTGVVRFISADGETR